MILSDTAIREACDAGEIRIDPFDPAQLNVTSYDLTLGDEVRVYDAWVSGSPDDCGEHLVPRASVLDVRAEPLTVAWRIGAEGFVLQPGIGYLMHTQERVWTDTYNPVLDGKSSIGRLFIQVHATAGYADAGYNGQYTLEVLVQHPIRVYAGMRIAQVRFHSIGGQPSRLYNEIGHYVGDAAQGAKPSQAWKQFLSR